MIAYFLIKNFILPEKPIFFVIQISFPCGQCAGDMGARGGAFGTEGVLGGYGGKGMGVGAIAAAAVFHAEYQPAVGGFGEGGIGLEHFCMLSLLVLPLF